VAHAPRARWIPLFANTWTQVPMREGPLQPYDPAEAISTGEAAERAGRCERTIREWCALHRIGRRIGGRWCVSAVASRPTRPSLTSSSPTCYCGAAATCRWPTIPPPIASSHRSSRRADECYSTRDGLSSPRPPEPLIRALRERAAQRIGWSRPTSERYSDLQGMSWSEPPAPCMPHKLKR
jgi:hypothetical protein